MGSLGWEVIGWVSPVEKVRVWGRDLGSGCSPPLPGVGAEATVGMDMGTGRGGLRCAGMEWPACC